MISNEAISRINCLLIERGLDRTWAAILHTHIKNHGAKFEYMLNDPFFADTNPLTFDLLDRLPVGEISVLYEYSLAHVNQDHREDEGQYFTPDDVSRLMGEKSRSFAPGVWVDPCSGIGNLSFYLINEQIEKEKFILNSIFFIDRDYLALFISRVLITIKFQNNVADFFNVSKDRFLCKDYLESNELPKYDYAILNPPYVVTNPNAKFRSALTKNTYAYFLEKVMDNTKGFISITPQSFTHSPAYDAIRSILKNKFSDLSIYCFDNVPQNIFKGYKFGSKNTNKANSTRAAIIIAYSANGLQNQKITPLIRWKTTERELLFSRIDDFLSPAPLYSSIYPKIDKGLIPLYLEVINYPKILKDLLSSKKTQFCLQIPSTPRYFISALKNPVSRSSSRIIYLSTKQDFNLVYLLVNSSYMYWWWRINDGGMTLSEKTLLTLPIPESVIIDPQLILELEESEGVNKVFKKNAGKINENVKHSENLIRRINQSLFPSYEKELIYTHNNSIFTGEEKKNNERRQYQERCQEN